MPEIRRRLIDALHDSDTGMSGIELSRRLGMSRTTMVKYLKMLAADGTLQHNDVGNIVLWSLESRQESFTFPNDYFKVASEYVQCLNTASEEHALALIHNCLRSGASVVNLIFDVIIPASDAISEMYVAGKIGTAEQSLLYGIISRSVFALHDGKMQHMNSKKNVIVLAADKYSEPVARAVSAAYRAKEWSVFELGDMSATVNVLFDLDFERLVTKVWSGKHGILITVVFSNSVESLNFLADSLYPIIKKSKRMYLLLCGRGLDKLLPDIKSCDYCSNDDDSVAKILQWSDTAYSSYSS